ncbi:MAG TPA: OsmC family protein [Nitrospiria bacterium]|nr:OsmC family protein [Nitrospiria bacterium]
MSTPPASDQERMEIVWKDGVSLEILSRGHRIVVDQPKEEGGEDRGMTPVELLVASLGSCIGYYAVLFFQRHRIPTNGLNVAMTWEYAEAPHRIGAMTAHVRFPEEIDPEKKERLQKVLEGCTVHNSISVCPKISVQIRTSSH